MNNHSPSDALKVSAEKRILNEFGSKILNEERLDKVLQSRRASRLSEHSDMLFHCECDDKKCQETILISTQEYEKVHKKTKCFIVVPGHVQLDLEDIVVSFNSYVIVAKFFPHARKSV